MGKQNEKERKVTHLEMEQLVRTASMLDDIKSIATMATQFSTESVDLCATPHDDVEADDHFDKVFDNVIAKQSQTQKNTVSQKKKSAKQIQMEEEQAKRRKISRRHTRQRTAQKIKIKKLIDAQMRYVSSNSMFDEKYR